MQPADAGNQGDLGLRSAGLRRLHAYWLARCAGRPMPARRDIDPLEFGWLLGHVSLIDVLPQPPWFRFRLAATGAVASLGYEVTGRPITAVRGPELRAYLEQQYRRVVDSQQPHGDRLDRLLDGRHWRSEAVYLPLSGDGASVDMVMVGRVAEDDPSHDPPPRWPGRPQRARRELGRKDLLSEG